MKKIVIVGRLNNWNGIGQITLGFLEALKDVANTYFIDTRPEDSSSLLLPKGVTQIAGASSSVDFDIAIYCDVTSNNSNDLNYKKCPAAKLKFIYSIFDSSSIPSFWRNIINDNFDGVLVASRSQVAIYEYSGVSVPVFEIPIVVVPPVKNVVELRQEKKLTFGFVGSNEPRKNIIKLINCFKSAAKLRKNIRLVVRTGLDFTKSSDDLLLHSDDVVEIYRELDKNKSEYYRDLNNIDVFISISTGEGYSIVPREMLALGKPLILSNAMAHADLLRECDLVSADLVVKIKADVEVPAYYPHVGDVPSFFGVQFDCNDEDVVDAILKLIDNSDKYFDPIFASKREKFSRNFSLNRLGPIYKSLVDPVSIRVGKCNDIKIDGYVTLNQGFYMKAKRALGFDELKNGIYYNLSRYHVNLHDAGFFSIFNRYLSHLAWAKESNPKAQVVPNWYAKQLLNGNKVGSFCYAKPSEGNLWSLLFESVDDEFNTILSDYENDVAPDFSENLLDFNEFNEPWLTFTNAYNFYSYPGFQDVRKKYSYYIQRYLRPNGYLLNYIDSFAQENFGDASVISVHIRHPSHAIEQPDGKIATLDLYVDKINEILISNAGLKFVVFLATDQEYVVNYMRNIFGAMIKVCNHKGRVSSLHQDNFNGLKEEDRKKEGHQIQHIMAANTDTWGPYLAEEVIIDAFLLARGDYFVHVTSNIATAVSFINPMINMVYCK
jgi:glycosyltransferase involved in cell wall biosynthesis